MGKGGVRTVVQACQSAKILLDNVNQWGTVGRGCVIYVSFSKGAEPTDVEQAAKTLMQGRLFTDLQSEDERPKPISVNEMPNEFDILIIPQASMGGNLKSKSMQYHSNVDKETGRALYDLFVTSIQANAEGKTVLAGVYGNRQGLELISHGPHTYVFDLP
eukprot:c2138_g1_i1.p1 GENE.c2138_g1_i1~~c2138_g1_i1.p1  ORF type:complete len:160 (-),score=31.05 c2138_g1_i1:51-530(-)